MTYQELLKRYKKKHGALVRPNQGFASLSSKLHLAYSMGRKRGFTDLGTHNPNSTLPGGGKSDHAHWPSLAYDLGRKNNFFNKGWNYLVARRYANLLWKERVALKINYIILGKKIISRSNPTWHPYNANNSHMTHIHVSAIH